MRLHSCRSAGISQCIKLYRASASDAQRARHYECSLCFRVPSPRTLPCPVLSPSCSEQHVNCCFTIPTNVSKLQPRQRAKPQPWPGVCGQMECNPGWEKRGEVIMRHPPSAGCLFGQTGCLAAQAVEGILMYMTNDSLASLPVSWLVPIPLCSLTPPFLPCEIQWFKMQDSVAATATALKHTCIFWYLGQRTECFLPQGFADDLTSTQPTF